MDLIRQQAKRITGVWDIEDLKEFGRESKLCPYVFSYLRDHSQFLAREMTSFADVFFVPYNYIVDPMIRESMDIHLKVCFFFSFHRIESNHCH